MVLHQRHLASFKQVSQLEFLLIHTSWSEGVDTGVGWLVGTALGVVGLKVVGVSAVPFPAAETLPKIMNMNTSAIFILKNILFFPMSLEGTMVI